MSVDYTPLETGTKADMHKKQTEKIKEHTGVYGKRPEKNKTDC
ncbi:MAG: hypothetical protein Q4G13_04685 [Moraxella sp.]|nr:hypothetical protein [Moraxella sp.]